MMDLRKIYYVDLECLALSLLARIEANNITHGTPIPKEANDLAIHMTGVPCLGAED